MRIAAHCIALAFAAAMPITLATWTVPSPAAARSCSEKHFACTVRCMDKDDTIMCVKRTCNHQEQQCLAEEARVPKTREPKGREPGVPKGGGRRG